MVIIRCRLFDGYAVSLLLYGITCCQAIRYYSYFPTDKRSIRNFVTFIWLMDTIHQALLTHVLWHYILVSYTHNVEAATRANWSLIGQIIPIEICAAVVECFFITRIRTLDGKNRCFLLLIPMSFGCLFCIVFVVRCYRFPERAYANTMLWLPGVFGGLRAFTDLAIAVAMCYILYSRYQVDLTQQSFSLVKVVVNYTMTTGLLTSVLAITSVAVYSSMPSSMIYIGAYVVHGKIYVNSVLAALNGRKSLRALASQDLVMRRSHFSLIRNPDSVPASAT